MKWQLCPKCLGNAKIPAGGTSSAVFETCPVCNGQRIIPEYQPESTEGEDARPEQDELWDEVEMTLDEQFSTRLGKYNKLNQLFTITRKP